MSRRVRVTVLVENTAQGQGLLAEHGLAYWIECGGQRVLFDTGQGAVLEHNAARLGIPLGLADAVVLSHGHYDHTGGLSHVLQTGRHCPIYLHPDAFAKKFTRDKNGTAREIGVPEASETAAWAHNSPLILTKEPTEIVPDLMVTGTVPRETAFEDTGGPFYLDARLQEPDPILDDQSLFFQAVEGTVVLLGCAHAGVINTLRYVQRLTGDQPIHAVLGGMHLGRASRERMAQTIDAFHQLNIARLGPAHCTGLAATAELWSALPGKCFPCNVGTVVEFETAR
jgi:7,8-dihydropterin-6-yl-methyl-4-(beta-D-ribofuranosyl)aminobenzene 5'-phosphate synthase